MHFFSRRKDTFDYELSRVCVTCDNKFKGKFCSHCGEKIRNHEERSILGFLENLLNAFTFLDGKFFKSIKLLITKPGQLSRNIVDGSQVPYMKMLSLFFVANFFYFIFPSFDSFNSSLNTQMNLLEGHSEQVTTIVNNHLTNEGITLDEFRKDYESQSTNISKLFVIVLALGFTVILAVINYSKKIYFFDHFLLSLEFYSFLILFCYVFIPGILMLIIRGVAGIFGADWSVILSDNIFYFVMIFILGYFLFRSQRNFYYQKWYWALPKVVLLLFLMRETWNLYRRMLFYITMWWM